MSQPRKSRYRATNWKQYNAALKARGSLTIRYDAVQALMCFFFVWYF
ncbi:hypothetical protein F9548_07800 [Escherichia coli]|nr:hypothetical protein [Escherichia coli]EFH4191432.1 hypothetical protein [Escherichia coli]EFH4649003.1 hypothetical protein [Escherichia coli]EFH4740411.1 hypothetical protein [Escherichia coli]EFH5002449.1 hypothetical protein [Escherichia coli]